MQDIHSIVKVETRLLRIPMEPTRTETTPKFNPPLEIPTVEITDDAGHQGLGFGYMIGGGGTAVLELLDTELVDWLLGQDARRITQLHELLLKQVHSISPGCLASNALAAIDIALWDLAGKRTHTPLSVLLGGAKKRVLAYYSHVGQIHRPLAELLELCRHAVVEKGFRALKIKVGKDDPEEDRERVARVREMVGRDCLLMLDADQSWSMSEAMSRLKRLARYRPFWIEEPLPATDTDGYRQLAKHTAIPRAGGESLYSLAAFHETVSHRALDVLQPDIARIGGITNTMRACGLAQAANLKVAPHLSAELSVAIAAAIPNSVAIEYLPQMEPLLVSPVQILDGYAIPSDLPGHGILFNAEAAHRFEVRRGSEHRESA